jgi:hypothetical protein
MMYKRTVQIFLFGLVGWFASSCREDIEPTPYLYTRYFTGEISKTWAMTLVEYTEDGEVIDRFAIDCAKDDEYIFYATSDRLYEVNSNVDKCFEEEEDTLIDTWSFNNASAQLTIILPILSSQQLPFIVRKVDDDDLTLEIFLDQEGIESYRIYFKLTDEE